VSEAVIRQAIRSPRQRAQVLTADGASIIAEAGPYAIDRSHVITVVGIQRDRIAISTCWRLAGDNPYRAARQQNRGAQAGNAKRGTARQRQ
jgi:hypothetical protein